MAAPFSVSFLDDVVVYTEDDKVALPEVLSNIRKAAPEGIPSPKASTDELKNFFARIIPSYDADKFYPSHMRKILQWYNLLDRTDLLDRWNSKEETT